MEENNYEDKDERPLDEILSELLWRTYQLKRKAEEMQKENNKSFVQKVIRWMNDNKN